MSVSLDTAGELRMLIHDLAQRPNEQLVADAYDVASKTASEKYYISILAEYENQILPVIPKTFLGLDFAMHSLYVASDEADAGYPAFW